MLTIIVTAILAVIAAFAGGSALGARKGATAERGKQDKARLDSVVVSKEIDDAVAGRAPAANREELGKWSA